MHWINAVLGDEVRVHNVHLDRRKQKDVFFLVNDVEHTV